MATYYYDFSAATNGNGLTPATPRNTWTGIVPVPGDSHLFKRGTSLSVAFSLTSGNSGAPIRYGAWYNADGSDDTTRARPIITTSSTFSSYSSTNKNYVQISNWDIRGTALAVANDSSIVFLGNGSSITNCLIDTNIGGVAAWGKSDIIIANNTIKAVSHSSANNNNCIIVSDTPAMANVQITGNTILHQMGGGTASHCIRAENTGTANLSNLLIDGNTITPAVGNAYNTNTSSLGIRLQRCNGARVTNNSVTGMLEGCFVTGGGAVISLYIARNNFSSNYHFGLHLSTNVQKCKIEYNTCSLNGTSTSNGTLLAYGRGIECSSSAGQASCSYHIIRYNTCNGNLNYGGPSDNGSEGVGIGIDDGTAFCTVYGNSCSNNEGNGIQYYGGIAGSGTPAISDTGANHCIANFLSNNCTASILSRRSAGTFPSPFQYHIGIAGISPSQTVCSNNVFVGGTGGISQNSLTTNLIIANNIFVDVPHAIAYPAAGYGASNNLFYSRTISVQKYCTTAVDGNGSPTYANLTYAGAVSDLTFNPQLDSSYRPLPGSPSIAAGISVGNFTDSEGRPFQAPPTLGMFELNPLHNNQGKAPSYRPLSEDYWDAFVKRLAPTERTPDAAPIKINMDKIKANRTALVRQHADLVAQHTDLQAERAAILSHMPTLTRTDHIQAFAERLRTMDTEIADLAKKVSQAAKNIP